MNHQTKVQRIIATAGYWAAARYLMKQGYSFDAAYWLIFHRRPRRESIANFSFL